MKRIKLVGRYRAVYKIVISAFTLAAMLSLGSLSAEAIELLQPSPTPGTESAPTSQDSSDVSLALPDLITLPPTDLQLFQNPDLSWRVVRFDNTIANIGQGPLEVVGEPAGAGKYQVRQRFYISNGQLALEPLLTALEYHSGHSHWHLADFARYELWTTNADGTLRDVVDVNGKVSYCLMDTEKGEQWPDNPRGYTLCGPDIQGISAGWMDTYNSHFPGQFLRLTGLPSGVYVIRSIVDPAGYLRESDPTNNEAFTYFRLNRTSVEELPTPATIWAWERPGLVIPNDLLNQTPLRRGMERSEAQSGKNERADATGHQ